MILRKTWRRNREYNPTTRNKQLRDDKIEGNFADTVQRTTNRTQPPDQTIPSSNHGKEHERRKQNEEPGAQELQLRVQQRGARARGRAREDRRRGEAVRAGPLPRDHRGRRGARVRDLQQVQGALQVHEPGVRELAAAGGAARVGGPRQLQDRRPAARVLGRRRRAHAEPPRALPPRAPRRGPRPRGRGRRGLPVLRGG